MRHLLRTKGDCERARDLLLLPSWGSGGACDDDDHRFPLNIDRPRSSVLSLVFVRERDNPDIMEEIDLPSDVEGRDDSGFAVPD